MPHGIRQRCVMAPNSTSCLGSAKLDCEQYGLAAISLRYGDTNSVDEELLTSESARDFTLPPVGRPPSAAFAVPLDFS